MRPGRGTSSSAVINGSHFFSNTVNVENPGRLHLPWPVPFSPRVIHGNFHLLDLSLPCSNNSGIHGSPGASPRDRCGKQATWNSYMYCQDLQ